MAFPLSPNIAPIVQNLNDQITALIDVREQLIQLGTPIEGGTVFIWNLIPAVDLANVKADMQSGVNGVALTMDEISQLIGALGVIVLSATVPVTQGNMPTTI